METNLKNNEATGTVNNDNYYKIVKPLRTYERDVAESVREKKPDQISINREEQKKNTEYQKKEGVSLDNNEENFDHHFPKKIFAVLILAIIIIGGTIVIPQFWNTYKTKEEKPLSPSLPNVMIKGDIVLKIDITGKNREKILSLITQKLEEVAQTDSDIIIIQPIEILDGKEVNMTGEQFLRSMDAHTPPILLRALGQKMTFAYQIKSGEFLPFLILEIDSFENAYANMLSWEKMIFLDLRDLITKDGGDTTNVNFQDQIISDKDARVMRKNNGEIALIYSFLNKNTLLFTNNKDIFGDILAIINP